MPSAFDPDGMFLLGEPVRKTASDPGDIIPLRDADFGLNRVRLELNQLFVASTVGFLTDADGQVFDCSDPANYRYWRTGSGWAANRTLTFAGEPPEEGMFVLSNNSGRRLTCANDPTTGPLALVVGHDPFELDNGEAIMWVVNPGVSPRELIKVFRGWEQFSDRAVPAGGDAGHALTKISAADWDVRWGDAPPYELTASGELNAVHGGFCQVNSADAVTVTAPAGVPAGWIHRIVQTGAGQVTIAPGGGRTLRNSDGHAKTSGVQWSSVVVEVLLGGTDILLTGDTGA